MPGGSVVRCSADDLVVAAADVPALVGTRCRDHRVVHPVERGEGVQVQPVPARHHLVEPRADAGAHHARDVGLEPLAHRTLVERLGRRCGGAVGDGAHVHRARAVHQSDPPSLLCGRRVDTGHDGLGLVDGEVAPRDDAWVARARDIPLPQIVEAEVELTGERSDVHVARVDELAAVLGGLSFGPAPRGPAAATQAVPRLVHPHGKPCSREPVGGGDAREPGAHHDEARCGGQDARRRRGRWHGARGRRGAGGERHARAEDPPGAQHVAAAHSRLLEPGEEGLEVEGSRARGSAALRIRVFLVRARERRLPSCVHRSRPSEGHTSRRMNQMWGPPVGASPSSTTRNPKRS